MKFNKASVLAFLVFVGAAAVWCLSALYGPNYLAVDGGCDDSSSPHIPRLYDDGRRITFCNGDAYQGSLTSGYFALKNDQLLTFKYIGYPTTADGVSLYIESEQGERFNLILPDARETWRLSRWLQPEGTPEGRFQLVLKDTETGVFGWGGLAEIRVADVSGIGSFGWPNLIGILLSLSLPTVFFWLCLLVCFSRFDLTKSIILASGMIGASGFVTFIYIAFLDLSPVYLYIALWGGLLIAALARIREITLYILKTASLLSLLVYLFALLVIVVGYYPFTDIPEDSFLPSAQRWYDLPVDNWIPKIFADQLTSGGVLRPMIGDWYASDRPPLQTGLYLLFRTSLAIDTLMYQGISSFFQALCVLGVALLSYHFVSHKNTIWIVLAVCFSATFFTHVLYVWPKLLSAHYQLLFFIIIFKADR